MSFTFPANQTVHFQGRDAQARAEDLLAALGPSRAHRVTDTIVRLLVPTELRVAGDVVAFESPVIFGGNGR